MYDDFARNGRFTRGTKVDIPRRPNDLIAWFMWTVVLCVPLFYYIHHLVVTGSFTVLASAIVIIIISAYLIAF